MKYNMYHDMYYISRPWPVFQYVSKLSNRDAAVAAYRGTPI